MAYFRNVHQSVKTRFKLYKTSVFFYLYDLAFYDVAFIIFVIYNAPGFGLCLLEAKGYFAFFAVHGKYLDMYLLSYFKYFLGMLKFAPGYLRDMQKSVYAADIYKSTVIGKSHYSSFHDIIDIYAFPYFLHQFLAFFIKKCLA